jgi:hypothetical protein
MRSALVWDIQEFLTLEDGTDRLSRKVSKELSSYAGNTPEEGNGVPRNYVPWVQQIQLRTEDSENGDLGAVAL